MRYKRSNYNQGFKVYYGNKNNSPLIFEKYRLNGYLSEFHGNDPLVFPSSGISKMEDQKIFEDLFPGLVVDFNHVKLTTIEEATSLEVGGEFIGWMPLDLAYDYVYKELHYGFRWEGIIQYVYPPEYSIDGDIVKNAGIRIKVRPQQLSQAEQEDMLKTLYKKHKDTYSKEDIDCLYENLTNDDLFIKDLYDTKTIFNAIHILLKENVQVENFCYDIFYAEYAQRSSETQSFFNFLKDKDIDEKKSFYRLIIYLRNINPYKKKLLR